ncbi:dihydroxyvitamin D(3) 24-hydroxylase, mitochondrial [Seminavis robusta]|uniref:Dihydroxyvitamin D(3) 24-hydroxylase, mitochondrial n=1 Tax=Seminavis robusta TaxID=568900 RepID=A0A9N8DJV2_9STRA|nr:dihydroxyvitamin D(3) 24-hydroxylase, mitochondrial [Seminavis robusta]|eukprot:Sro194_g082730.1 dihydroxyvitamin D(3) 24-hydroxylase, mitochondrial (606) ;mRNA; f:21560-23377
MFSTVIDANDGTSSVDYSHGTVTTLSIDANTPYFILLTLLIATVVLGLVHWFSKKMRIVRMVEVLPGPSLSESNNAFTPHPWLAHLSLAVDFSGENPIPGYPGVARSFDNLMQLHKQFSQKDGIMRLWALNPFKLLPFAQPLVFITDPEMVQQVLKDKNISKDIIKEAEIYGLCKALAGDSFLEMLEDTPRWKHQRKLTALGMNQSLLERTNSVTIKLLYETVFPQWDGTASAAHEPTFTMEAGEWCTRLAAEILGIVAFSRSFGGLDSDATKKGTKNSNHQSLYALFRRLQFIITKRSERLPFLIPFYFKENKEFQQCQDKLNSIIQSILEERMSKYNQGKAVQCNSPENLAQQSRSSQLSRGEFNDLLSYLMMEDEDDDRYRLTEKELLGNVRMFLFAGQDTSAIVLSQTLYELATHQSTQLRLQKEVDALFAQFDSPDHQPAYKDIMRLEYLDAVTKEALRLHSPAGVARWNLVDIKLTKGDHTYSIPKGTNLFVYPCLTGRGDGQNHESLDEFIPERFLKEDRGNQVSGKPESCYMPFSIGPRNCVGHPLATAEIKVVLAHLVHRYTVRKTEGSEEPIKMVQINIMPHQIMLDFERRQFSG